MHALTGNVTGPLIPPSWRRRWPMVEVIKSKGKQFREAAMLAFSAIAAAGVIGGFIMWLSGVGAGQVISADKFRGFEAQIGGLSAQIQKMQDQLNAGPRADQLVVLDRHLSAQDGRMDSMDSRMRDLDQRLARSEARQQMMEDASRATLNRR